RQGPEVRILSPRPSILPSVRGTLEAKSIFTATSLRSLRAWMIALHEVQGVLVGVVHLLARGGELQHQVGGVAHRPVVVERELALEVAKLRALEQILVLQNAIAGLARLGVEPKRLVVRFGRASREDRDSAPEHDVAMTCLCALSHRRNPTSSWNGSIASSPCR